MTHKHRPAITLLFSFGMALGAIATSPLVAADTPNDLQALQQQVEEVKAGQEAIQKELAEIKRLIQAGARPSTPPAPVFEPADVSFEGAPTLGEEDAVITLIEFSDFQCPFCRRHYTSVMPQILENYVEAGTVKYVMREFPLTTIHPQAKEASNAALCAGEQDAYWGMHDLLFDNQRLMTADAFKSHAAALELDTEDFAACLEERRYHETVEAHLEEGRELGITGTPSFVIGLTDAENPNAARVTKYIRGAQGYDAFSRAINELIVEADRTDSKAP